MRFSVIMPSFLGEYNGSAKNREEKLIRAVQSVIEQTFEGWELIVVADGCSRTFDLMELHFSEHSKIRYYEIPKQPLWNGAVRNFGITRAKGEFIVYLDSDDYFGKNHLEIIEKNIEAKDWVWFNDFVLNNKGEAKERTVFIDKKYQNGTSNICHRRILNVKWGNGYGMDDWGAVQSLLRYPKYSKIPTPQYYVCHIPNRIDV